MALFEQTPTTSFGQSKRIPGAFGQAPDLSTSEGLLELARMQGGNIAEAADELAHPERGILSTIGEGFKSAFSEFVNVISTPSHVVAGIISPEVTIAEAVKKDITPSEVLLGKPEENASTMKKVGDWFVRTAIDVLSDPLTYVSFGAAQGIFGLSAAKKITATKELAKQLGIEVGESVALSPTGKTFLEKAINMQINGLKATALKEGAIQELSGKALQEFVQETISSKLNREFVEKSFANLLAIKPQLVETLLDKGGIKFFGKSILSGQRINSAIKLIPGFTYADHLTQPIRNATSALFDTSRTVSGQIPEESVAIMQKWKDISTRQQSEIFERIPKIWKEFGITAQEDDLIRAAVEANKIPADPHLAAVWKVIKGYQKRNLREMWNAGLKVSEIPNYIPHFLVDEEVKAVSSLLPPKQSIKHAMASSVAKFVDVKTGEELIGTPEILKLTPTFRASEIKKIQEHLTQAQKLGKIAIDELNDDIVRLSERVQEYFKGKVSGEFDKILSQIPEKSGMSTKAFFEVLEESIKPLDVEALVSTRAKEAFQLGVKAKKSLENLSEEGLLLLQTKLVEGEQKLPGMLEAVNAALKEAKPTLKKAVSKKALSKEVEDLMTLIKEDALQKGKQIVSANIDKQSMAKFIEAIAQQFRDNPDGVKGILDTIIGKKQKITDVIADLNLEELAAKTDLTNLPESARFFIGEEGKTFERVRATVEDAAKIGINFDRSGISTLIKSSLNVSRGTAMIHMVKEIGEKLGQVKSLAPESWVPVSVKGLKEEAIDFAKFVTGKNGEELVFHPEVAKRLEEFMGAIINDEATNKVLKAFDRVQNLWKASVTSIFPSFHGRNAISNVFLNFLDLGYHALNPATHFTAADLQAKEAKAVNLYVKSLKEGSEGIAAKEEFADLMMKKIFTDSNGYDWTFGELRQVIAGRNVAFTNVITGAADLTKSGAEFVEEIIPEITKDGLSKTKIFAKKALPISQQFVPFQIGRNVGSAIEQQARLVNFITNLKATGDVSLAAQRTKQFLFDYQNLTGFEKMFLRRIIPFYVFTRKNLELQTRALLTTPGRVAAELTALNTLGDVMSGGKLSEEEKKALPDWIKSGIGILKEKKGSTVEILGSLGTPIEQPFQAFQPNQLLGSISPIFRVPVEQMSGYSFFQGKALSDVTNAAAFKNAPKFIKDFIGFTELKGKKSDGTPFNWYVSLRPERMNLLLNLPPTSRVFSSLKQMQAQDVSTQAKTMQSLIGTKVFSFDLEREAAKREKELRTKLEDLLNKAGVIAKFNRTFIPKEK